MTPPPYAPAPAPVKEYEFFTMRGFSLTRIIQKCIKGAMMKKANMADTPVAKAIVAKRTAERLTITRAADAAGLAYSALWRLETTTSSPSVDVALKISRWLGMPIDVLFPHKWTP